MPYPYKALTIYHLRDILYNTCTLQIYTLFLIPQKHFYEIVMNLFNGIFKPCGLCFFSLSTAYEILVVLRCNHGDGMVWIAFDKGVGQPRLLCRIPLEFIGM